MKDLCEIESRFWEEHLLFRDYLRAHPAVARRYEELKRESAARFSGDREGYTESKTKFIRSILAEARADC